VPSKSPCASPTSSRWQWPDRSEKQIRQIQTFKAVPNEHVIAVDEALGYRVSANFQSFELPVDAAVKLAVPS
jgi:hypothetical protein